MNSFTFKLKNSKLKCFIINLYKSVLLATGVLISDEEIKKIIISFSTDITKRFLLEKHKFFTLYH